MNWAKSWQEMRLFQWNTKCWKKLFVDLHGAHILELPVTYFLLPAGYFKMYGWHLSQVLVDDFSPINWAMSWFLLPKYGKSYYILVNIVCGGVPVLVKVSKIIQLKGISTKHIKFSHPSSIYNVLLTELNSHLLGDCQWNCLHFGYVLTHYAYESCELNDVISKANCKWSEITFETTSGMTSGTIQVSVRYFRKYIKLQSLDYYLLFQQYP